jgi:hypothetical protein
VLLLLELVEGKILQGLRKCWRCELPIADFLQYVSIPLLTASPILIRTLMLPFMSFLTGLNAAEPNTSNRVVRLSAASRNSVVGIALSLDSSSGTSTKLFLTVSKNVLPGGYAAAIVIVIGLVV